MRRAGIWVLLMMFLVCFAVICPAPKASADITIRVADIYPEGHALRVGGIEFFMKEVEKRSQGKVKFDYYGASTLVKGGDIPDAVIAGTAQMGNMVYVGKKLPIFFFPQLPGTWTDEEVVKAGKAMWNVMKTGMVAEGFDKLGLKLISGYHTTGFQVGTTKKPVRRLSDIKGLKIRVAGSVLPKSWAAIGAVPVSMPIGDAFEGMERGVLDGVSLAIPSFKAYAFFELLKYGCVNMNIGGYPTVYTINKKFFNSLPFDIQKILETVGELTGEHGAQFYLDTAKKDLVLWEKKGIEINLLPPEDKAEMKKRLEPIWDEWIQDMEKRGYKARDLVKRWQDELKAMGIK